MLTETVSVVTRLPVLSALDMRFLFKYTENTHPIKRTSYSAAGPIDTAAFRKIVPEQKGRL